MSTLQEDAKKLLPFVQAMADGKTVETCVRGDWFEKYNNEWSAHCVYRVKPEPKLRPYTREEWEKVDKVRHSVEGSVHAVMSVYEGGIYVHSRGSYEFSTAFRSFTHLDGSPCGVEE